jgi:hypothetical protein
MKKNEMIMKDLLVEKLRQISALMGDDINVALRVSKDKCEIAAIGGVNTQVVPELKQKQDMVEYIG